MKCTDNSEFSAFKNIKLSNLKKRGWGYKELKILFGEFLKYKNNVIFTKDIHDIAIKVCKQYGL